jgi:hypothetical protein
MIEYAKLIIDFGLVVLVWVVQFAIYPGFRYFKKSDLQLWHPIYSRQISWVVAPLMLAQLGIAFYMLTVVQSWFVIGNLILVAATWIITFFWAVPLHKHIENHYDFDDQIDQLITMNLIRAWIWTIICIWTIVIMTV